jgi:hypothetical protein
VKTWIAAKTRQLPVSRAALPVVATVPAPAGGTRWAGSQTRNAGRWLG